MEATIYDMTRLTGYGPGTVARVLNHDPPVKIRCICGIFVSRNKTVPTKKILIP